MCQGWRRWNSMCKFSLSLRLGWTDTTSSVLCQTRAPGAQTTLPALGEAVFGRGALGGKKTGNKTSKKAKLGPGGTGAGWDLAARKTPQLQLSKRV